MKRRAMKTKGEGDSGEREEDRYEEVNLRALKSENSKEWWVR
jgi:hypothetical protein